MVRIINIIFISVCAIAFTNALKCLHESHEYSAASSQALVCQFNSGKLIMADFNGDGRSDWYCNDLNDGTTINDYYSFATFAGTFYEKLPVTGTNWCSLASLEQMLAGDVNGDGKSDLICRYPDGETYGVRYYEHGKFSNPIKMHGIFQCDITNADIKIGDVNADGVDDFVCVNKASGTVTVRYNYHHHRSRRHSNDKQVYGYPVDIEFCAGTSKTVHLGDLNGDKAMDLICHNGVDGTTEYSLADRHHGFSKPKLIPNPSSGGFSCISVNGFRVHDINGDGLADLYCDSVVPADGKERILPTDQKLLFTNALYEGTIAMASCDFNDVSGPFQLADLNGDRRDDLVCDIKSAPTSLFVKYAVCQQ